MRRARKAIAATAVVLVAGAFIGSGALIRTAAQGRTYSDVSAIPHRKVGLLLGCSRRLSDGRANLFFAHRVAAAAQLYKARKVDYLIVSGDNHMAGYDEATDMKRALVAAGIPEQRIYCDYAGFRTLDSVVRAKEVFGQTAVTVISQEFHNRRAIYIARSQGIDALGFNAKEVDAFNSFRTKVRERFALVKTVLDVCLLGTHPKFLGPRIEIGEDARVGVAGA
ncbi:MAG: ElyC/SanA/YdcF family protein [bacterium]